MKTVKIGNWIREHCFFTTRTSGPLVQTGYKQVAFICLKREGKVESLPNRWRDGVPVQNVLAITLEELSLILNNHLLDKFEILVNKRYVNLAKYLKE